MLHPPCFRPSEHKGVGKVLIFADFRYSHSHFLVFSAGLTVFILQFEKGVQDQYFDNAGRFLWMEKNDSLQLDLEENLHIDKNWTVPMVFQAPQAHFLLLLQ